MSKTSEKGNLPLLDLNILLKNINTNLTSHKLAINKRLNSLQDKLTSVILLLKILLRQNTF